MYSTLIIFFKETLFCEQNLFLKIILPVDLCLMSPNCILLPVTTSFLQFSRYFLTISCLQQAYLPLASPVYLAGQIAVAQSEHMCADLLALISENGKRSFPQLRQ